MGPLGRFPVLPSWAHAEHDSSKSRLSVNQAHVMPEPEIHELWITIFYSPVIYFIYKIYVTRFSCCHMVSTQILCHIRHRILGVYREW